MASAYAQLSNDDDEYERMLGTTSRTASRQYEESTNGLTRRKSKRAAFKKAFGKLASPRRSLEVRQSSLQNTAFIEEAERIANIEAFLESGRCGPRSPTPGSPTGSTSSRT